ncbi:hypothetical protein CBW53_03080 [Yersinia frederiksenii]|nr:hypothetical protein CBW53_03080 [Yersinia frederiksenii]CNI69009.1 Uncharacterized protein conserved in bacteria [Yersinia frederiksenii]
MKRNIFNVISIINAASNIQNIMIDGEEHIIINGAVPIIDDVVMKEVLYPKNEITKSINSLEGVKVPLDHPKFNGVHVSADDPRAINQYHVGAWAQNVRKDNDKTLVDIIVNKRYANSSEKGKGLISRLDDLMSKKDVEPIHLSVGLNATRERKSGTSKNKKYNVVASNMKFDHVAILPKGVPGAGLPSDGIGIFVNSEGEELESETVFLNDASDYTQEGIINKVKFFLTNDSSMSFNDIHNVLRHGLREMEPKSYDRYICSVYPNEFIYESGDKKYKQKYLIDKSQNLSFVDAPVEVKKKPDQYIEITNSKDNENMKDLIINSLQSRGINTTGMTDEQLRAEFSKPPVAIVNNANANTGDLAVAISNAVSTAIKPLNDKIGELTLIVNSKEVKEEKEKREAIKAKLGFSDLIVNSLTGDALNEVFAKTTTAAGINSMTVNSDEDKTKNKPIDVNAMIDAAEGAK